MINVYEYLDYRKFLQDFYSCKKNSNPLYSYAVLAKDAGISSRGLVKLIFDGKRNLSLKTIPKIIQGVKLGKAEGKYFFTLVRFNQAKNINEKNELYTQLLKFTGKKNVVALAEEQYNIYSKWYYSAIYEMLNLKDYPSSTEELYVWISKKLFGEINPKQAKEAISDLEKIKLISFSKSKGKYVPNNEYIENPGGKINFAAQMFHKKVIEKALNTFERPLDEREISGLTLAIKAEDIPRAKTFIAEFTKNFNFDYCAHESADHVYQLNIQFYELTDRSFVLSEVRQPDAATSNSGNLSDCNNQLTNL